MTLRVVLMCLVLACLAALSSCPANEDPGGSALSDAARDAALDQPGGLTPKSGPGGLDAGWETGQAAIDAWMLVETSYFVIQEKWRQSQILMHSDDPDEVKRGNQLRDEVSKEIDHNIFFVNSTVEQKFLEAIEAEPENPLNYATFAYYLKPRKRMVNDRPVEAEGEAIEWIDKAIELGPDEAMLYVLKAHIMMEPQVCHDWFRASPQEEVVLSLRIPEVSALLDKAAELDPDNNYIDFYKVFLLVQYGDVNVNAQSLISTFDGDPVGFKDVFKNRAIRVLGVIDSFEQARKGLKIIMKPNPDKWDGTKIACYFREEIQSSPVPLEAGNGFMVVGQCDVVDGKPVMKDCYFETSSDASMRFLAEEEMLAAIHSGNRKSGGKFYYPPPLRPHEPDYFHPLLAAENTVPVYVDHWARFGTYEMITADALITRMTVNMTWPEDKDKIGEIMYFLYELGNTLPYDHSFFGLQLKLLQPFAVAAEPGSQESLDLAAALRYLNEQYLTVANDFYGAKLITDITKVDVRGIHEVELNSIHNGKLKARLQGHQAAFLKRAGEILDIDFPLPDDPEEW